jgi:hypothetical protein
MPFYVSLFTVFTDQELESLLDRSDMLPAASVSSNTAVQTNRDDRVKIYKLVDQRCGDSKLIS